METGKINITVNTEDLFGFLKLLSEHSVKYEKSNEKSGDIEDELEDSYDDGFSNGYDAGYADGYNKAKKEGKF